MLLALIQILYVDARGWDTSAQSLAETMNQQLIKLEEAINEKNQTLEVIDIHYKSAEAFIAYQIVPRKNSSFEE